MNLELSEAERELLLTLLHERLDEFREEVRRSQVPDFREQLKVNEDRLRDVIRRLEVCPSQAT